MQYKIDKTPVATKNLASLDTSIEMTAPFPASFGQICPPYLNGYSIVNGVIFWSFFGVTSTFTSKFTVVYNAHIANI